VSLVDAVKTILDDGLPDSIPVFRGRVIGPTPERFVIVTALSGTRTAETFNGDPDSRRSGIRLTVTATMPSGSSGSVDARAEWLVDQCERLLTGVRPVVAGQRVMALTHDLTRFMGADERLASLQSAYYVADFTTTTT